jgi:phosphoglycolate phosphatase-like HAD superfamily hydrolase
MEDNKMAINTVVCDFDGTLTDSERSLGDFFPTYHGAFAEELGFLDNGKYLQALRITQDELRQDPNAGWVRDGYVVAPINSDPFAFNTASHLALLKDIASGRWDRDLFPTLTPLTEKRWGSITNECHLAAYKKKKIVFRPGSKEFVETLLGSGYNVSIVSNSGTADIEKALLENGFPEIPVVGMAKKYDVDSSFDSVPESLNVPGLTRPVLLRRGLYNGVLESICPNSSKGVVVADNFELDLALPLHLGFAGVLTNTPAAAEHEKEYVSGHPRGTYASNFEEGLDFIRGL